MSSNFFKSVSLLTLSILISPISHFQAEARWGEAEDANIECIKSKVTYKVKKSGEWTATYNVKYRALSESGRQNLTTHSFVYDRSRSSVKILEASTSLKGNKLKTPAKKIEDKPLPSDSDGLSNNHRVLVPFQQVEVGSIIHIKYEIGNIKPDILNSFNASYKFSQEPGCLWQHKTLKIKSKLPLHYRLNDPKNVLEVSEKQKKSKHHYKVKLTKPFMETLVQESEDSVLDLEAATYATFSTELDHKKQGQIYGKKYEPLLTGPLPKTLNRIKKAGANIKDETECINTIIAGIIDKITYLGTWDTADGNTMARSLEEIAKTGYGDCKEYSACLAAILRKLGYTANVALVFRGEVYQEANVLPIVGEFNHAIVKAISPSGKTYWLDPTNDVTMADGIFADIADRPSLVLDPENPVLERVPPIDYQHARSYSEELITISENGGVKTEGEVCFQGEEAKGLTNFFSVNQHKIVGEFFIKTMCLGNDPINPSFNLKETPTRTVRTMNANYSFEEQNVLFHTNKGYTYPLNLAWHLPYVNVSQKDEGALFVGSPHTLVMKKILKDVNVENLESLEYSIQTPWLNAKRELAHTSEGVTITETIERLKSIIPAKDLKTKEFDDMRKTLRRFCNGVAIVFSN